ncbi:Holliday junction resolvase RuvX [Novosphingopyxis baekryungensis]|uniref:Holliday junction resolvase RuvX n=1 Tax=Novosphingopyxis baekryungensis TaxID=279369 RepID=UPI0004915584|nr:Holliday junction resolvase RuvX [Novosphingopyxis baekryungensis]
MVETAAGLRALLPQGGALIGLDLGTKTIGTAFCDAQWTFATPAKTIKRRKFLADREELRLAIESRDARGIVLGLPRNLDGTEGPRCQSTRAFARNIADLALPILLWDERWSTQAVERAMIEQDVSRGKRAERIDSAAAAYILQGAIDALVRD